MSQTLNQFLEDKPLFYEKIDYERMPRIYEKIKSKLPHGKIIHLVGTNGKGTTGRFLATALFHKGFKVGHYTSPHILKFNERIWKNRADVNDKELEAAHQKLYKLLGKEDRDALSYFEYTTLLAMVVFSDCDYIVMEAGLGGEYDATAVFDKELSVFTPIDFDHQAFLGESIQSIATTKLNVMDKKAIIGLQKHEEVYFIATEIARKHNSDLLFIKDLDPQNVEKIDAIAERLELTNYLKDNLALAVRALLALGFDYNTGDFLDARLFGRLSKVASNIYLDVGHNALAASAIAHSLHGRKVTLIYNTYKDKDFKSILTLLKPIIDSVEIIKVDEDRIVQKDILESTLKELSLPYKDFASIDENLDYLVFGSFSVAESFLKGYIG
ncbi:bifunctional folylpolyglutamate synthase/dihydrofolate synthase [bacterium]|nr:bifunctional folylpolyglutamate synthase/dihydrofolate synthase [bacterium]MBU1884723.1 bifunctional folylpolyglutamate synthase/dihydrofolate synthase [bacterium]